MYHLLLQAIIHPDTGKKVFMPLRMSGFVPFGTVTVQSRTTDPLVLASSVMKFVSLLGGGSPFAKSDSPSSHLLAGEVASLIVI